MVGCRSRRRAWNCLGRSRKLKSTLEVLFSTGFKICGGCHFSFIFGIASGISSECKPWYSQWVITSSPKSPCYCTFSLMLCVWGLYPVFFATSQVLLIWFPGIRGKSLSIFLSSSQKCCWIPSSLKNSTSNRHQPIRNHPITHLASGNHCLGLLHHCHAACSWPYGTVSCASRLRTLLLLFWRLSWPYACRGTLRFFWCML